MQTISINYIADMNQKFADFHCHPHVRSFNYFEIHQSKELLITILGILL